MFSRVWKPDETLAPWPGTRFWNSTCESIDNNKGNPKARKVQWRYLEPPLKTLNGTQKQKNKMAVLETENGVIMTDPVQIAETLNDMFVNVASRLNLNNTELGRFS